MKKIIIASLLALASVSLIAADSVQANKSDIISTIDGAVLYKQRCSICHGEKAKKSPKTGIAPLAGRDVARLALKIRAYRDQDNEVGSYTMHKDSQIMKDSTSNLSREQIVSLAKYISGLN